MYETIEIIDTEKKKKKKIQFLEARASSEALLALKNQNIQSKKITFLFPKLFN